MPTISIFMARTYHNIREEDMLVKNEWIWFLGFMWADGHVGQNRYSLELKSSDFDDIWPILQEIGFTTHTQRTRYGKYTQKGINAHKGIKIFQEYEYMNKSKFPPIKLWNKLTFEQKCLFLRGFFEGDGSYAKYNQRNSRFNHLNLRITLNGPKDYDWSFILDFFKDCNISPPCIERKTRIQNNKERNYSILTWTKNESIKKIFDLLYNNNLNICLERKYKIASFFLENYSPIKRVRGKNRQK